MTPRAAVSWSGGKDACLALLRAREQGLEVGTLLTMAEPDGSSKSHALPRALVAAQAGALGLELRWVVAAGVDYARVFGDALRALRADGHTHLVFGDVDLQAHRDWLVPMCEAAGLVAVFPLWKLARAAVAAEVVDRGIRAWVVCVDTRWLGDAAVGVAYDRAFIDGLPPGVCPCGEGGEFHTFVWDAPGFTHSVACTPGPLQRVASRPPFAPTEFALRIPRSD